MKQKNEIKAKKYLFSVVSDADVEDPVFLNTELKITYKRL